MDSKAVAQSIASFSYKFCNEVAVGTSSVSSPLSAEILLALLTLGASKEGHNELIKALGIPNDDAIRASFSTLTTSLKAVNGVTLNVANKIYIMQGNYKLVPTLQEDAVKIFDAAFETLNFANNGASATTINQWVEQKTNNRIKDLIQASDLSGDTRLVLVNAIYFKGSWKKQFDKKFTEDRTFHIDSKTQVEIPMMFKSDDFRYGESEALDAQLLEMAYEGNGTSMLVVLPRQVEGLGQLMKKLADGFDLTSEMQKMYSTKVQVTLPKFKIETEIDLNTLLPKLGIKKIFDSGANVLDRLLDSKESLFVSKAIQKAFIEVNEEGAEAAAATGVVTMLRSARVMSPLPFLADRPFLFALLAADRSPIFLGTFCAR